MIGEEELMQEVFLLAVHLHWSRPEILEIPILERRRYVDMLRERLQRQAEVFEQERE